LEIPETFRNIKDDKSSTANPISCCLTAAISLSRIYGTEGLKKPIAHIVVGYDLHKAQNVFIG